LGKRGLKDARKFQETSSEILTCKYLGKDEEYSFLYVKSKGSSLGSKEKKGKNEKKKGNCFTYLGNTLYSFCLFK
jgi:hypothetical protein